MRRSGVFSMSHELTSRTSIMGTGKPTRSAMRVANSSFARTRMCCGLFWNLTT